MDEKEQNNITAFDVLFTNNHIQMLKIMIPYFDFQMQKQLAIYIKYLELQHTISYYKTHSFELSGCSIQKEEFDIFKIYHSLLPYFTKEEKKKAEQIINLFDTIEKYKEMSKTIELMKDFFPEGFGEGSGEGFGNTDMLMNMLSPEQKTMFEMFSGI
ncbi:hypothetical protein [Kineothrix sp. MB12-C1]|uniref:hypothetical protein n=1 Tax=Kineothrix sp. MB12-C1 TaxID=3070215 RepID=UPI0027D23041|nr:hypothetical protein [Kineothrix sp. MB12-C1]WMC92445.1 hypothetical protein RBB56_16645 [Kineothrix sp. MB12-C1]